MDLDPSLTRFLPVSRMLERARVAREDSDSAYYLELLYIGEVVIKTLVLEALAGLHEDKDGHKYALTHRLVRADGIGEWADVLDAALTGPASPHLAVAARDSQQALTMNFGPPDDTWQRRAVDQLVAACRCLDEDFEDLSRTKISVRQWVRSFVWLRNRTRGHGAPKSATLATVCPSLESSLAEMITSAPALQRPWAHLRRNLSGKFRVTSFGSARGPFEYLTAEPDHALPDGAHVMFDVPKHVPLLISDPDLTDFFLPNGNWRNGQFEVMSYITDERRSQDGSDYVLPPGAKPASETTALPVLDVIGNVFTNMPPRRDSYVQRPTLERELAEVLVNDRFPVVTLHGRGGVGKTSLALEVLHELARGSEYFAIVWFSARDIDLLPQGPRVVRADVLSVEDVARDFAALMQPAKQQKVAAAIAAFTQALAGQTEDGPFIFVFDNFETVREQAELYSYLSNAIRPPNKVLITSRNRDFKADYPIEVRGMTRDEYRALVAETARRLDVAALITAEYEDQLYDESDGHPYITKVLLGEVAQEGHRVSLKRIVAAKEAMLDALFDRSFAALSPAAQRVFLTLCSWRSLVPRIGLEAVLLRPGNERFDVERALADLQQASLVEDVRSSTEAQTFLSVPLAAALFGRRKLVTSPMKIAIDADMELVREFGATSMTDVSRGLAPRVDRLTKAAAERLERGEDAHELAVIEYIATAYPPAWLNLAELQQESGDIAAATQSVSRYLEAVPEDAGGWTKLSYLYRSAGDHLGEMHARLQRAELADTPIHDISSAASRLNGLLHHKEMELDADERRLMVRRLRSSLEARTEEADATDLSRLAWLCMHDKDPDAARAWVEEGIRLDPENPHCQNLLRRFNSD